MFNKNIALLSVLTLLLPATFFAAHAQEDLLGSLTLRPLSDAEVRTERAQYETEIAAYLRESEAEQLETYRERVQGGMLLSGVIVAVGIALSMWWQHKASPSNKS